MACRDEDRAARRRRRATKAARLVTAKPRTNGQGGRHHQRPVSLLDLGACLEFPVAFVLDSAEVLESAVAGEFVGGWLGLGLLGEYLGKIIEETKQRPPFVRESLIRKGEVAPWRRER